MTWTLIILIFSQSMNIAAVTLPNFQSVDDCAIAGEVSERYLASERLIRKMRYVCIKIPKENK